MMLTQKDAKTMAKSLRNVLGNRNVQLSHSDCLEIVAQQFGLADWNTLSARLLDEENRRAQMRSIDATAATARSPRTSGDKEEDVTSNSPPDADEIQRNAASAQTAQTPAPWSTCSFCGKSPPEVRILLGGCGGWEGFRARRNPESGERSNAFICNECIVLCAKLSPALSASA